MNFKKLTADLAAFETEATLNEPLNFAGRAEAIDLADFIEQIGQMRGYSLSPLRQKAQALKRRLETINTHFCQTLRADIRLARYRPADLKDLFEQVINFRAPKKEQLQIGYDGLDILMDGLLQVDQLSESIEPSNSEMIHLEPTPARIVLDLVDQVSWRQEDVFYDLGAGLGHVAILVNLLTKVRVKGIEIEPTYCAQAQHCVAALGLDQVKFINLDVRQADYTDGTVFFMFTPFQGQILQTVLARLAGEAQARTITLCTYGPCTSVVAAQPWLEHLDSHENHECKLARFRST